MNRKGYLSDPRYAKVLEQMDLLGIMDISTTRQSKNGTIVWKLPIKVYTAPSMTAFIEVGSFASGYVRNQNSGYSNYQLNKRCDSEPEYFDSGRKDSLGRPMYTKYTTRTCKLIPVEIDRLEYLLNYCVKNYFIKRANEVTNGEFIPKWRHEYMLEEEVKRYDNAVQPLESELAEARVRQDVLEKQQKKNEETYYLPREVVVTVDGHRYKVQ
jgi:hypothetical protein